MIWNSFHGCLMSKSFKFINYRKFRGVQCVQVKVFCVPHALPEYPGLPWWKKRSTKIINHMAVFWKNLSPSWWHQVDLSPVIMNFWEVFQGSKRLLTRLKVLGGFWKTTSIKDMFNLDSPHQITSLSSIVFRSDILVCQVKDTLLFDIMFVPPGQFNFTPQLILFCWLSSSRLKDGRLASCTRKMLGGSEPANPSFRIGSKLKPWLFSSF